MSENKEAMERFEAGNSHLNENRPDEALEEYRAALKADADFAEAYNNLGLALFYKSSFDEAIVEYRNAIRIAPDFAMARANLGLALLNQDLPDEAVVELKKAVRLDPELAEAYYNMGIAYNKKGLIPEAISAYEGFLQYAPDHFSNYVEGVKKIVGQLKLNMAGNS